MIRVFHIEHSQKRIFKTRISLSFLKLNFKSWSIVFFGNDEFSLTSLNELNKYVKTKTIKNLEIVTVNTTNPVYKYASFNNFKIHLWPPLLKGSFDLGVVVSFGKLIPKQIIDLFPLGIINVHGSLLPKWRGGMPIIHAIKNGDTITGISVIKITDEKFDMGNIILKKSLLIGKNEMMPSVHKKLKNLGSKCLTEIINGMPGSLDNSVLQSNEEASYALKLQKKASVLNWNEITAIEVYNLYRAFFGLYELSTTWYGITVKLSCIPPNCVQNNLPANEQQEQVFLSPGSVYYNAKSKNLIVKCKKNSIRICSLKVNGKLYNASSFNRGFLTQKSISFNKFGT